MGYLTDSVETKKLDKAKDLTNKLGADVVAYNKHCQNLQHKDDRNGWSQLFRGGEANIQSVVAHNVHEADCIGCAQKGGTDLLMFSPSQNIWMSLHWKRTYQA